MTETSIGQDIKEGVNASRTEGRGMRPRLFLQLTPGLIWLVFFFVIPSLLIFAYSFFKQSDGLMTHILTLDNYIRATTQYLYIKVFAKSLWYALAVTFCSIVIGYPCAYFLARTKYRRKEVLFLALIVPFWTTIVVRTYAWKMLLGSKGIVNYFLVQLGLVDDPVRFLYTQKAVIIGLIHVFLPFMILPLYAALEKIDPHLEEAAQDQGANRIKTFWRVTLPLSFPGLSTGCLLVFLLTMGSFITPDLLGGPKDMMISNVIQSEFYMAFNWPFGSTLAILLLFIILTLVVFYNRIFKTERIAGK